MEPDVPRPKINKETEAFRRLIYQRLQRGTLSPTARQQTGAHLDEDALSAFVEGRLSENESAPLVSHLVACGFCRRITAQLIRLESAIGAGQLIPVNTAREEEEPGSLRRFLADLAARVLPSTEDEAVFAYHAPAEDFQQQNETEQNEETGGEERNQEKQDGQ